MVTNGNRISEHLPPDESRSSGGINPADLTNSAMQVFQAARSFVAQQPVVCLAGAFTAGMVIAWFIKRTR